MSANEERLDGVESLVRHMAGGGTLKTAAGIGRDEMEAIYSVAFTHFNGGKHDKAEDLLKFLCLYDHTEPRWFYGLGVVRQSAGKYREAVDAYSVATLLDVDDPRPQAQAGYCLMAMESWPEAQSALEGAVMVCDEAAPSYAEVRKQALNMLETVKAKAKAKAANIGKGA